MGTECHLDSTFPQHNTKMRENEATLPRIFLLRSFVRQPWELSSLQQDKNKHTKTSTSPIWQEKEWETPFHSAARDRSNYSEAELFLICAALSFQGRPSFETTLNSCDVFLSITLLSATISTEPLLLKCSHRDSETRTRASSWVDFDRCNLKLVTSRSPNTHTQQHNQSLHSELMFLSNMFTLADAWEKHLMFELPHVQQFQKLVVNFERVCLLQKFQFAGLNRNNLTMKTSSASLE